MNRIHIRCKEIAERRDEIASYLCTENRYRYFALCTLHFAKKISVLPKTDTIGVQSLPKTDAIGTLRVQRELCGDIIYPIRRG